MLVQFTVKNFLSFKDEVTLDLSAIHAYKEHSYNLIDYGQKEKLVKVAAIYGANASGKTNIIVAMKSFQDIIKESFNNVDDNQMNAIERYYSPFRFEKELKNTEFEIVEIIDGFEYKYGFEYNEHCIVNEWLYRKSLKTNRMVTLVERTSNQIVFGRTLIKECELYKEQIPKETLVLSFFNKLKLKTDIFSDVYEEIMSTLVADSGSCESVQFIEKLLPNVIDIDKENLLGFLNAIDTGIKDVGYKYNGTEVDLWTIHSDLEGNDYKLDFFAESQGTIKSISIYMLARIAIERDKSMFIDELNSKLHPLLLKFIIDLFYESNSNAQLIYTTHDTTLLDKKFFRRDQIWFVQKDKRGCSDLVALSDYKVRSDASFEKDYLAGVYGGIPFLKDFKIKDDDYGE